MSDLSAEVLIARGKYATLSSERRGLYKDLRGDMEAIVGACQRALRSTNTAEDVAFALEQTGAARKRIDGALDRLTRAATLTQQMTELKPLAWGDKRDIE